MEQGLQIDSLLAVLMNGNLPLGLINIEKFSGNCQDGIETPFSNWLDDFCCEVEPFHLSDEEKARVLVDNLTGQAREEIVFCLSEEKRRSYKEIVKALRFYFSQEDCYYLQSLFHSRVQRTGEDLASFSRALMRLYAQAVDAAEDEETAAALRQLRDEALSSRFVSGARDVEDRRMLRYLYLKHRGSVFEMLRREALIILHDASMLREDVLTTDDDFDKIREVLHESVVQQDLSAELGIVEDHCELVSTLLDEMNTCSIVEDDGSAEMDVQGEGHDVGDSCLALEDESEVILKASGWDVGPEMSPENHVVKEHHRQALNAHVAQFGVRLGAKGGNRTGMDDVVGNWMLKDMAMYIYIGLYIGLKRCSLVSDIVWGPWESQWKPNSDKIDICHCVNIIVPGVF